MEESTPDIKSNVERAKNTSALPIAASVLLSDGSLAEMVYRREENRTLFCISQNGTIRYEPTILDQGERLVPYSPRNTLLKNGVVLFPSEAAEYGSEPELISDIQGFIHRYVDLSPLFEQIATYYVLFSWVYDNFNELPYLRVRGDAGSGKTRFLLIVGSICYKPFFASAASTVSPLFRILDVTRGTLVVDEGDFRISDEKAELIKILNNGNGRGFPVLRTEAVGGKELVPRAYQVFGPKLIATRGFFQDRALETRCLTEEMGGRRLREDIRIHLPNEQSEEALRLRNKLLMFRLQNFGRREINPQLIDRKIEPRLSQVFVPLLSVIEDRRVQESLQQILREYQKQLVSDRGMDIEAQVLEIIRELQSTNEGALVKEITQLAAERLGPELDRKVTARWVGNILRRKLGLKTERRHLGYAIAASEAAKLAALYEKYGLENPVSVDVADVEDFAQAVPTPPPP